MMRKALFICILLVAVLACTAMPVQVAFAETSPVLLLSYSKNEAENEIVVTATLKQNEGIADMLLTLEYDTEKLTLAECRKEEGGALASLDLVASGSYDVDPYKLHWSGDYSDATNGTLLTMRFAVKEGAEGEAYVRFTYTRGVDVLDRVDGDYKARNLMADSLRIELSAGKATEIVSDKVGESALVEEDNTKLVVGLAVGGSLGIVLIVGIPWLITKKKRVI